MPTMTLRVTNATFESTSNQGDYASVDAAYNAAVVAALAVAAGEVQGGQTSSIVEIAVDLPGQRYAARGAVAVSTARLLISDELASSGE